MKLTTAARAICEIKVEEMSMGVMGVTFEKPIHCHCMKAPLLQ